MKPRLTAILLLLLSDLHSQSWQWVHQISSPTGSVVSATIVADKANNIFVCGAVKGSVSFQGQAIDEGEFIMKLNGAGQLIWVRSHTFRYMTPVPDNLGGYYLLVVLQDNDFSSSTGLHYPVSRNSFVLLHFNSDGTEDWSATGTGYPLSRITDDEGNTYITGFNSSDSCMLGTDMKLPAHYGNFVLYKISAAGKLLWVNRGLQLTSLHNFGGGLHIMLSQNKDVVCFGYGAANDSAYYGSLFLARFSNSGTLLSHRWVGPGAPFVANYQLMQMDSDDHIYTVNVPYKYSGAHLNRRSTGFDSLLWATELYKGGYGGCSSRSLPSVASDNGVIIPGRVFSSLTYSHCTSSFFDCGSKVSVRGDQNFFLQKLDSDGECKWMVSSMGLGADFIWSLTLDRQDNCYMAGAFQNLHPVSNWNPLTLGTFSLAGGGFFIAKYGSPATSIEESAQSQLTISPNPASDYFLITVPKNGHLLLTNAFGQVVQTILIEKEKPALISAEFLAPGVYIAEFTTSDGLSPAVQKLLVQH